MVVIAVGTVQCATNPATGKRQLSLIGEQAEIEIGRESDAEVKAAFGDYDDEALESYVRGIGERLAAKSERPDLPWSFEVLDDASVNAMALPGGFIYVTRGILAHMNSEAELAGVLGHEIGHVTARHSVNQMSKQQLYGGLFAIGMIASPELQAFGDLAGQGLGLLFLKFGRDAERQADDLGLRYMVRGDYDPREMPAMFEMLEAVSSLSEGGRAPSWMSTHPNPEARGRRSESAIAALDPSQLEGRVGRREHLDLIDGLVFGADPRQGYFLEATFLHPELAFGLDLPQGWKTINGRTQVVAVGPDEDMLVELSIADEETASAASKSFLSQEGVSAGRTWARKINGLTASGGRFEAQSGTQMLRGSVMFVEYDGRLYRLLGYGLSEAVGPRIKTIETSMRSFHRVVDRDVLSVKPDRLDLVEIERPMTLETFQKRFPSVIDLDELAVLNRLQPDVTVESGTRLKRIVGQRPLPDES